MARLVLSGNAVTITTNITKKDFTKLMRYFPEGLTLYGPTPDEVAFKVELGNVGSASNYGIIFDSINEDDCMYITLVCDSLKRTEDITQTKENILNDFAMIMSKLKAVEANCETYLEKVSEINAEVNANIEIL